ncbi:MAG: aminotransferase class III-fold pyridoxal phosphate-dependent enzyme, partial [Candidatus Aminicenantes bacterium]
MGASPVRYAGREGGFHDLRPGQRPVQRQRPATGTATAPGSRGKGASLGVRGLTLCRRRSPATRRAPHNVIPGSPGRRDESTSPGNETGRRRAIGVVAALSIHHPSDHADGATLGRHRRPRRPGMRYHLRAMKNLDYSPLLRDLAEEHRRRSPRSAAIHEQACRYLIDGGSHAIRLLEPFPPRITKAHGGWMVDEDGHRILDLWQGHLANVLGHNPEVVTSELSRAFAAGFGAQSGLVDALQAELAALVCRLTSSERVRFTTSGSLSTMYSVLMARSFTGRSTVMQAGGGWHGAQPMLLKGVTYRDDGVGFSGVDSKGLPSALTESIVVTRYNDPQNLADDFDRVGDDLACLILEPMLGAGGTIAATT